MKWEELSSSQQQSLAMKFWLYAFTSFLLGLIFVIVSILIENNALLLITAISFATVMLVFLVLSVWVTRETEPKWLRKASERMKKKE